MPQPITYAETVSWMDENGYEGDERTVCLEVIGATDQSWRGLTIEKARLAAKAD